MGETMDCHECARAKVDRPAVEPCRYCSVGPCKDHLVEVHRSLAKPRYDCLQHPERGFDTLTTGPKGSRSPAPHRAA